MTDDEIPCLMFAGEMMLPDRDSYSMPVGSGNVATDIAGGPMRVRTNTLTNSVNVTCTYTLDAAQTMYFMSLYYGTLRNGIYPIKVRLDLNGTDLLDETIYVATIVPESVSFPQYPGTVNRLTVTYNAVPVIDRCVMEARMILLQAFGGYPTIIETAVAPLSRLAP